MCYSYTTFCVSVENNCQVEVAVLEKTANDVTVHAMADSSPQRHEQTSVSDSGTVYTPRKSSMSQLSYAKKCLSRTRVSLWRLKHQKAAEKSLSDEQSCTGLCKPVELLPVNSKQFFTSQIHAMSVAPRGMRWSSQDKLTASGLYYKSPSAYRFMRHTFRLPSESTLKTYVSQFHVTTGFESYYMFKSALNL